MGKTAFLFPGQGSQKVGMAKDLAEDYQIVEDTFEEAKKVLEPEVDIKELAFFGPEDELTETENTQPAILTASVAILRLLKEEGIEFDFVAGHSLGEYSALVAAGVVDFASALKLVRKRGLLMRDADPKGEGTMAAIIGLDDQKVEKICQEAALDEVVQVANYNCPGQVVITGHNHLVEKACEVLREGGARRVIPLEVSAPFHSPLMQPAAEKLAEVIADIEFAEAKFPVVANINAEEVTQPEEIKEALLKQVYSPVLWEKSVHTMMDAGCETFVEVGTGDTLSGFLRRISRQVNNYRCEKPEEIEEVAPQL